MNLLETLISSVGHYAYCRMNLCFGLLKQPEVMSFSIGKRRTDYLVALLVHDNLTLQSVLFLLP